MAGEPSPRDAPRAARLFCHRRSRIDVVSARTTNSRLLRLSFRLSKSAWIDGRTASCANWLIPGGNHMLAGKPLSDKLGTEISEVDLSRPLGDEVVRSLLRLFHE